jgi:hypothetical protein
MKGGSGTAVHNNMPAALNQPTGEHPESKTRAAADYRPKYDTAKESVQSGDTVVEDTPKQRLGPDKETSN